MARFKKSSQPYRKYESLSVVRTKLQNQSSSSRKLKGLLDDIVTYLDIFSRTVGPDEQFPNEDFNISCLALEGVTSDVHAISHEKELVECLEFIDKELNLQSALFLEKISSVTQSVNVLLKSAHSHHVRPQFFSRQQLENNAVANEEQTLDLPQTVNDYKLLAQAVLVSQGEWLPQGEGEQSTRIMQSTIRSQKITILCECALHQR